MDATAVSDESDRELLARWCEARDHGAFAALVERHRPLVAAVCRRELRDPAEIDDVAQEVFIALAEEASSIRGSPGAWLRTVALHRSLNHVRARQRRRQHEQRGSVGVATAEAAVDDAEEDLLTACLAEIDPGERDLLVQLFFLGHSQAEVARSSRVSALVVHRRLKRALASLRERFARRKRRVGLAMLALLLAGGDRPLAAAAMAVPGRALGWVVAGTGAAALAALGLTLALSTPRSGDAAPAPADPRPAAPPLATATVPSVPGSTAPGGSPPGAPALPGERLGTGSPPAAAAGVDGLPPFLRRALWQDGSVVRLNHTARREAPPQLDAFLSAAIPLAASPAVEPLAGAGPPGLGLPAWAWRVVPPPGRSLLLFTDIPADIATREQVIVFGLLGPGGTAPKTWMLTRQLLMQPPGTERQLAVQEAFLVSAEGLLLVPGERKWRWRAPSPTVQSFTVDDPMVIAGWGVQALAADEAQALVDACAAEHGSCQFDW